MTYNDLPPEAIRVARSMVRGILYNLDETPLDEELIAKNIALFVLNSVGWEPAMGGGSGNQTPYQQDRRVSRCKEDGIS